MLECTYEGCGTNVKYNTAHKTPYNLKYHLQKFHPDLVMDKKIKGNIAKQVMRMPSKQKKATSFYDDIETTNMALYWLIAIQCSIMYH